MDTFLNHLPYDILRLICGCLDVNTLLNVALASHALNEIASLSLYTSITFNPDAWDESWIGYDDRRNPIMALQRRPNLRMVVRSVTLCTSETWIPWQSDTDGNAEQCFQALALLPAVTFLAIRHCSLQTELHLISQVLPQLLSLQILDLQHAGKQLAGYDSTPSTVQEIRGYLTDKTVHTLSKAQYAHKVRTLRYEGGLSTPDLLRALAVYTTLTRFSATDIQLQPSEICQVVSTVPSLQEALFACDLQPGDSNIVPTGAKQLTYLRIKIPHKSYPNEGKAIGLLVQCLAATSQLQRLDIVSKKWESKALNGDALLSQILPLHGKTLQELKIPNFRISSTQLRVVLMQCVNLKVLWLGVTAALQRRLPALLANSCSLETLRVFGERCWDFAHVLTLLGQTCQSLRLLKVCTKNPGDMRKDVWKAHWEYDELLGDAVRKVVRRSVTPLSIQ